MKMGPLDQDTLDDIRYNAEFVESVINKALGKKVGYSMEGVTWLDDFLCRSCRQRLRLLSGRVHHAKRWWPMGSA
jgi:hypothetical protein